MPVAKYYVVGAFFINMHTCFYGNETSQYLSCEPPTLNEYLSLVDNMN